MSSILSYVANKAKLCVWCAALLGFVFQRSKDCLQCFVEDSNCGSSRPTFTQTGKSKTSSMYVSSDNLFFFLGNYRFDHLTDLF